jgi:hypothetical protein
MKFDMSSYKMHFNHIWKDTSSQEINCFFFNCPSFGRFYLAHFKLNKALYMFIEMQGEVLLISSKPPRLRLKVMRKMNTWSMKT